MKTLLLILAMLAGGLMAWLVYERLFVETTMGPTAMLSLAIVGAALVSLVVSFLLCDTRHRETVTRIWMAGISTAVTYVVMDLVAGLLLIKPLSPALALDEYRHHKLVPSSYSRIESREFSYVQRVNSHGLRGQEATLEKPRDRYRILMLGDSFTMGKGVQDDETFSVRLAAWLNARLATCGRTFEVLNAGVDSYAPVLELVQLTRDLQPLGADMVILNLDVSDLVQEQQYRKMAHRGPDGEIIGVPGRSSGGRSLTETLRSWVDHRLFLTRAALVYANQALGYRDLKEQDVLTQANAEITLHTLAQDTVDREAQWNDIFDSIMKIKSYSEHHDMHFLLSVYPWPHQYSDSAWIPGRHSFMPRDAVTSDKSLRTVQAMATAKGIALLDAYPAFRAYTGQDALYYQYDMHWTPAGHRVMATALGDLLLASFRTSWCE